LPATMRAADGYADLMGIERLYRTYPGLVLDVVQSVFTVDARAPRPLRTQIRAAMRARHVPLRAVLRDGLVGVRSI
ncbi:MAG TPA: hypothetical protein VIK17_02590, partial [Cellulomonas sp.]